MLMTKCLWQNAVTNSHDKMPMTKCLWQNAKTKCQDKMPMTKYLWQNTYDKMPRQNASDKMPLIKCAMCQNISWNIVLYLTKYRMKKCQNIFCHPTNSLRHDWYTKVTIYHFSIGP